jgi:hypothetical protein
MNFHDTYPETVSERQGIQLAAVASLTNNFLSNAELLSDFQMPPMSARSLRRG